MRKILKLASLVLFATCAAASAVRAAESPPCDTKDVLKMLRPVMATHTPPPYPEMSVMTNEQGTTLLAVTMGVDGVPTDVQIIETSGSIRLDEAARDYVKQIWRWAPTGAGCTAFRTRVSIKWDVRDAPRGAPNFIAVAMKPSDFPAGAVARHEKGVAAVLLSLNSKGEIANLKVAQGSGFPDLDAASLEYVRARHWTAAQMDGKPVFTVLQLGLFWGVDDPALGPPG